MDELRKFDDDERYACPYRLKYEPHSRSWRWDALHSIHYGYNGFKIIKIITIETEGDNDIA